MAYFMDSSNHQHLAGMFVRFHVSLVNHLPEQPLQFLPKIKCGLMEWGIPCTQQPAVHQDVTIPIPNSRLSLPPLTPIPHSHSSLQPLIPTPHSHPSLPPLTPTPHSYPSLPPLTLTPHSHPSLPPLTPSASHASPQLVYSSTCATYGNVAEEELPITE